MANNITLKENEPTEVTFKYGNVTKSKSKKDDSIYYVFDCDEGRINANDVLAQLIADNWCGRGGTMKIEKLNKTRFDVEVIDPAERIYPLEMRAWDDSIGGFAEIEFDISGAAPAPAQNNSGPKAESSPSAAKKGGPAPSLDTYASLMAHCIQLAKAMCGEEVTEPQQKIAVTLFMEAARKGLAAEMEEEEEETNDTGEETDEKETEEAPRKLTKSDIEDDDLPF